MSSENEMAPGTAAAAPVVNPISADESNLMAGLLAGVTAAVAGALVWAAITVTTKFQIGYMAVAVGFLVAWAVRKFGKGSTSAYGVLGGACALLGCLLGNFLSACGFLAASRSAPVVDVTLQVLANPSLASKLMQATFSGMDVLFYAIAVYEGYKFARRPG
jgi:hypothetical protein